MVVGGGRVGRVAWRVFIWEGEARAGHEREAAACGGVRCSHHQSCYQQRSHTHSHPTPEQGEGGRGEAATGGGGRCADEARIACKKKPPLPAVRGSPPPPPLKQGPQNSPHTQRFLPLPLTVINGYVATRAHMPATAPDTPSTTADDAMVVGGWVGELSKCVCARGVAVAGAAANAP